VRPLAVSAAEERNAICALRHEQAARYQGLAAADRQHQSIKIISAVEHCLVAPQHFVDRKGASREASLCAPEGQSRLMKDLLAPWFQARDSPPAWTGPDRLQRLQRWRGARLQ